MSYANLITPKRAKNKQGKDTGDPKYGLQCLFKVEDMDKFMTVNENDELVPVSLDAVCKELAKTKWPGQSLGDIFPKDRTGSPKGWPIKSGDKLAEARNTKKKGSGDAYIGMKFISAKSNQEYRPRLMVRGEDGKLLSLDMDKDDEGKWKNKTDAALAEKLFRSGSYAKAEITVKAVELEDNFITCYLNKIQFVKEGPRLGGGGGLMERFDGIDGGESDYDPTMDEME
jgi:hypothetical protein